eukprot:UN3650
MLHIGVLFMQKISQRDLYLMVFHHTLSVTAMGGALLLGTCHYWACLNGCCEVTNIFLNNVWLFKELFGVRFNHQGLSEGKCGCPQTGKGKEQMSGGRASCSMEPALSNGRRGRYRSWQSMHACTLRLCHCLGL